MKKLILAVSLMLLGSISAKSEELQIWEIVCDNCVVTYLSEVKLDIEYEVELCEEIAVQCNQIADQIATMCSIAD